MLTIHVDTYHAQDVRFETLHTRAPTSSPDLSQNRPPMNLNTAAASLTLVPKAKHKALSKLYVHKTPKNKEQRTGVEVEGMVTHCPFQPPSPPSLSLSPTASARTLSPRLDLRPQRVVRDEQLALQDRVRHRGGEGLLKPLLDRLPLIFISVKSHHGVPHRLLHTNTEVTPGTLRIHIFDTRHPSPVSPALHSDEEKEARKHLSLRHTHTLVHSTPESIDGVGRRTSIDTQRPSSLPW